MNTLSHVLYRADGNDELAGHVIQNMLEEDGGPGSGNWGHEGRPGKVGGSTEGGGAHNRILNKHEGTFTSHAKERKALAKPHTITDNDLIISGSKITGVRGSWITKGDDTSPSGQKFLNTRTGELLSKDDFLKRNPSFGYVEPVGKLAKTFNVSKFSDGFYPASRMNAAFKATRAQQYDKVMRARTGRLYRTFDKETKEAFQEYTVVGFEDINGVLRGGDGNYSAIRQARVIADAIEKSEITRDVQLFRGVKTSAAAKFLKVDEAELQEAIAKNDSSYLDGLVNKIRTDDGFLSCSSASVSTLASYGKVQYDIFVPKGTKGIYAEPFSDCGAGDGSEWDGKKQQANFSEECETILQCGTSMQILGWYIDNKKKLHLKCAVIGQNPIPIKLSWASKPLTQK